MNETTLQITRILIWQCIAMFVCGQALYLLFIKIPAARTRAEKLNKDFTLKEYWSKDWNLIVGMPVVAAMLILGLQELVHWKAELLEYIRWFFGFVGMGGSSFIIGKYSSYEKMLNRIMDIQSDVIAAVPGVQQAAESAATLKLPKETVTAPAIDKIQNG